MPKITPFLWFDDNAEEAVNFYMSVFEHSKIERVNRSPDPGSGSPGKVMSVTFQLEGQELIALNGGPHFKFTEAISLFVSCQTQEEVDALWARLTSGGGQAQQCGWLKDKFGLSWQIIPTALGEMLNDPDRAKANRVLQAMLQMTKLDIARLKQAYASA